jgi:hypothetical protein
MPNQVIQEIQNPDIFDLHRLSHEKHPEDIEANTDNRWIDARRPAQR